MAPRYTNFLTCFKKTKDDDYMSLASSSGSGPLILRYYCNSSGYLRISIIDDESEKECKVSGIESFKPTYFVGCYNGLALFTTDYPSRHIVVDPLSNKIMATINSPFRGGDICGFFFHPLAKEYRILSVRKIEDKKFEYQLYLFGSQKWRKIENPYFEGRPRRWTGPKYVRYLTNGNPAVANDALHWDMGQIMVFDMISEVISFKDAPFEGANYGRLKYIERKLLVKEDCLCFCFLGCEEPLMEIWVLEDYPKWSWTKKYTVDLDWDMTLYPMESGVRFTTLYDVTAGHITIVGIQNNELVLLWKRRGMFSYHLGSNTLRKIHLEKSTMKSCMHKDFDLLCGFETFSAQLF